MVKVRSLSAAIPILFVALVSLLLTNTKTLARKIDLGCRLVRLKVPKLVACGTIDAKTVRLIFRVVEILLSAVGPLPLVT